MSRRHRHRPLLPGLEALETRQMLHGAPADEPRAVALRLVEQDLAAAQHRRAEATHAHALATRLAQRVAHELALCTPGQRTATAGPTGGRSTPR